MKLIQTTVAEQVQADQLAHMLVERRLAACVQTAPITSTYRWQGQVEKTDEVLLMIKTLDDKVSALEAALAEAHPYDVPEIVRLDIEHASDAYTLWAEEQTATGE